jgi:tetratricopeptide (TPR) repeat protein
LAAGLSMAQVGGEQLTRQAVHLFESGRANPSARSLELVADRLGVSVESLVKPATGPRAVGPSVPDHRLEALLEATHFDEVVRLTRAALDEPDSAAQARAVAHHYMGRALCQLVKPDLAIDHLRRARGLAEATGDQHLAAESMEWEAFALHAKDDPGALATGLEALERYQATVQPRPETLARMHERLASYLVRRRAYDRAQEHYERALGLIGPVRDLNRMARIYHGLSHCHWVRCEWRRGVELAQMAVSLYSVECQFRPYAAKISLPRAENDLGTMLMRQGQLDRAEECLTSALHHFAASDGLAELRCLQGRSAEARSLLAGAVSLAERLREVTTLAAALQQLAELDTEEREFDEAEAAFLRALGILDEAGLHERRTACLAAYERMQDARSGREAEHARTS